MLGIHVEFIHYSIDYSSISLKGEKHKESGRVLVFHIRFLNTQANLRFYYFDGQPLNVN